jgi:hypothetical protein
MKQTREDLDRHLQEQVEFLRSSSEVFDHGKQSEAKRLATSIRILLHDTGSSRSLLRQLEVKESLQFVDTSHPPDPPDKALGSGRFAQTRTRHAGLSSIEFGGGHVRYTAPLASRAERVPLSFNQWWKAGVVRDIKGHQFSRRDLVLGLAHLDGGAHVDPELDSAYAALTRSNSLGWEYGDGGTNLLLAESPVLANVRQIAYEVLLTLERAGLIVSPAS